MSLKKEDEMIMECAKAICEKAGQAHSSYCLICQNTPYDPPNCSLWEQFTNEAMAAVETVRRYARLDYRTKPRT